MCAPTAPDFRVRRCVVIVSEHSFGQDVNLAACLEENQFGAQQNSVFLLWITCLVQDLQLEIRVATHMWSH